MTASSCSLFTATLIFVDLKFKKRHAAKQEIRLLSAAECCSFLLVAPSTLKRRGRLTDAPEVRHSSDLACFERGATRRQKQRLQMQPTASQFRPSHPRPMEQ